MNSEAKSISRAGANAVGHTPGPWTPLLDKPNIRGASERMALVVTTAGHIAIDCTRSGESYRQDCANAHLIAAAPELLAVAKELASSMYDGDPRRRDDPLYVRAAAAIAKAEGR